MPWRDLYQCMLGLWGTNAVNGVINIITRSASTTHGALAGLGTGSRRQDMVARYSAKRDNGLDYRLYAKYLDLCASELHSGASIKDAAYRSQAGMRADWRGGVDRLSMQANLYSGAEDQPPPGSISISGVKIPLGPISVSGANAGLRWERAFEQTGRLSVQLNVDRTRREVIPTFAESLDIIEAQFQHTLPTRSGHELVWGADLRHSADHLVNSSYFAFLPADLMQNWASLFAQDQISFGEHLQLTIGTRIERNDYTGVEYLPNARLAWTMQPGHLLWGGLARSVRAPARLDHDAFVPGKAPFLLNGGASVCAEPVTVLELGYRAQLIQSLLLSLGAFRAQYANLYSKKSRQTGARSSSPAKWMGVPAAWNGGAVGRLRRGGVCKWV